MSEDLESILRKSLDEVDRNNKRMKRMIVILGGTVAVGLEGLAYLSLKIDLKTLIMAEFGFLFLADVALALRTWIAVASSTTKVLKAIELLSKQ